MYVPGDCYILLISVGGLKCYSKKNLISSLNMVINVICASRFPNLCKSLPVVLILPKNHLQISTLHEEQGQNIYQIVCLAHIFCN